MYNIYFDKRVLKICDISSLPLPDPNTIISNAGLVSQTDKIIPFMENLDKIQSIAIPVTSSNIETTFQKICSQFTQINAAGGVVENQNGEYLLILRHGLWDLPKGKQEEGEDIATTAVREVEEECGITSLELKELICITRHTYHMNGKHMLKHTYWYKMTCTNGCNTKPQTEEDIQEVKWVKKEALADYLANTYPSIKEVFENL
jgi:ADP-ribose pyrophosphatase YjhB (NUDIX family)